jgi:4-nitrophenyl phosphatase
MYHHTLHDTGKCSLQQERFTVNFGDIQGVIMDMDGVLWRGDEALPGVLRWFAWIRGRGLPFALATNNSMKTPADYVQKLAKVGIEGVQERQILTSGTTTVDYMHRHYPAGTAVHILGGDGLRTLMTEAGYVVADEAPVVIVGLDTSLTYEKLRRASALLRNGAAFIGTNADPTIPTPSGLAPGGGSIVAALRTASDVEPIIMGKPNAPMFEAAVGLLETAPEQTLMIGDRLDTDIAGGRAAGFKTVLVLTGVATREKLATSAVQPDGVYEDLEALAAAAEITSPLNPLSTL